MLTEVCDFIHNYFEYEVFNGAFEVDNGMLDLETLVKDGQRFRIRGSALNDGIYTYHQEGIKNDDDSETVELSDEFFTGTITSMSVPRQFLQLVQDIADWQTKNKAVLDSPYVSESFGGYSYTKATGSGANAGGALSWQDVFKSKLNAYRKIA